MNTTGINSPLSGSIVQTSPDKSGSSVIHAVVRGSIGFATVGLISFYVWAAGGKWFQAHLGEAGLYGACALVFILGSGLLLHPLVLGPGSFLRFYAIFIPAFVAYTMMWCAAWFLLRFGLGEWLGSLLGSLAFAIVTAWRFGSFRGATVVTMVLFGCHSAGYFSGGELMYWLAGPGGSAWLNGVSHRTVLMTAKLSWGLLYGLGFGAGIGYAFHAFQKRRGVGSAGHHEDGT